MAISSKSSVLGLMIESTEGTPLAPTGATKFIALQGDAAMAPSTAILSNDEIKSSLGPAKPILGAEAPTFSGSHYLRASGVEGQAPNYGPLLKSVFGAEAVASTQYNTVASSTTSVIKVDAGEGATFQRGEGLLIKDGTNGYRIRAIDSISTDDLTIGFQVPVAPGTAVDLGKCSLYYPANSGHPTLSLFHYLGNGGATQMLAGGRCVSADFSATAGEMVNGSYSVEGISYYFNPIEITSSNNKLNVNQGASELIASVTAGWYKNPEHLAEAVEVALDSILTADITVTYSKSTGKFTITAASGTFQILWKTGTNGSDNTDTHIGTKLGFSDAADDTGGLTYTSDNAQSFAAPYTPTYDGADPLVAKNQEVMFGTATDYACAEVSAITFNVSSPKSNITSICAESGVSGSVVSSRTSAITVSGLLTQYDSSIYNKYRTGDNVKFQYSFGEKVGGNWTAGACGYAYFPTCTVSSFEVVDVEGLLGFNLELAPYVNDSGEGECFIGFL